MKKRKNIFSTKQKLKELRDYKASLMPVNDMDLVFMDLSTHRRERAREQSVDGDDPSMELMERMPLEN